ncbi:Stemmadenine O-acetyltransferase [Linum grandiflorum]
MEVTVISVENIKPSSGEIKEMKPFKLSSLDQMEASTYIPLVHFYPFNNNTTTANDVVSSKLKASLSQTLTLYYPLSGRVNSDDDTLYIHDFQQGVPFTEARIHSVRLAEFLQPPKLEFLNKLLPFEGFCLQPRNGAPFVAVQLSTFDCGGIALGLSFYHRVIDAATFTAFLDTWAAYANPAERSNQIPRPDLVGASSTFPPHHSIPPEIQVFYENQYYRESVKSSTRRFVFYDHNISLLRSSARSDKVETPTRNETLSAFIWKCVMKAAAASGSPNLLKCFTQAINMRSRMGQRLSRYSIGNLVAGPLVSCNNVEYKELVLSIRNAVRSVDKDYLVAMSEVQRDKFLEEFGTASSEPVALAHSCWIGFGVNNFEFGLGKPVWTGVLGHAAGNLARRITNFVFLKEVGASGSAFNNGLEAWITLDKGIMDALESDPEFLKFASPNPSIVFN